MSDFNDIGVSRELCRVQVRKLLLIGFIASVLHLIGDMILGWGTEDETLDGVIRMFSAYTSATDSGIFVSALLGMFGMTLEGLCRFGIYRLMAERAPECAHRYRSGIFGYLIFGVCGFHVPTCAAVFLMKHGLTEEVFSRYYTYFALPAVALFWVFFIVLEVTQIRAFAKGLTPYPKWCAVFSMPVGMLIATLPGFFANIPFLNALSCAWIAFGNLWMFGGLFVMTKKARALEKG